MEKVMNWGGLAKDKAKPKLVPKPGQTSLVPEDKAKGQRRGDNPPGPDPGGRTKAATHKLACKDLTDFCPPPPIKRGVGRPPVPIVWTPEYIQQVVEDMEKYTDETDFPTEAEFCYTRQIRYQRLNEHEELRAAKEMMFAKRQAMLIRRGLSLGMGEGPLGAFISRIASQAGPFSITEKQELAHSGSIGVQIVDDV
jgi:hypothetical protein